MTSTPESVQPGAPPSTAAKNEAACPDYPIFAIRGVTVTWGDVLASAEFMGLLTPWLDDLARVDAVLALPAEERPPVDAESAQEMLTQLRYHHNLITAEETAAWLDTHLLHMDDLQEFLTHALWREQVAEAPLGSQPSLAARPRELGRRLWVDMCIRDAWPEILPPIQRRYLVELLQLGDQAVQPGYALEAEDAFCKRSRIAKAQLEVHLAKSRFLAGRWPELLRREAIYQQFAGTIASPDNCRKRLPALRTELYLLSYEAACFPLLDVVREAYLCVTVDGEPLAAVTRRANGTYSEAVMFIEDLPKDLEQYLVSARVGELLEPIPAAGGGYYLVNVREKREPSLDHPEILQRVRRHLIEESLKPYLEEAVEWPRWQLIPSA